MTVNSVSAPSHHNSPATWPLPQSRNVPITIGFLACALSVLLTASWAWGAAQELELPVTDLHQFRQSIGLHTNMGRGDYKPTAESVRLIAAAGVRRIRNEINWAQVEQERGIYTIPERDMQWVTQAYSAGLDVIVCLNSGCPVYGTVNGDSWSGGLGTAQAPKVAFPEYAGFARAVATELGQYVHTWEIFNEPRWNRFPNCYPDGDEWAVRYALMANQAADAIREVQPDAVILAVANNPENMAPILPCLEDKFDFISIHSGYAPLMPERRARGRSDGALFSYPDVFAAINDAGLAAQLCITEQEYRTGIGELGYWGYPPATCTERDQAKGFLRAYCYNFFAGIRFTCMVELVDYTVAPRNGFKSGLLRHDRTPKAAYFAVQRFTRALGDTDNPQKLSPDLLSVAFESEANDPILALLLQKSPQEYRLVYWQATEPRDPLDWAVPPLNKETPDTYRPFWDDDCRQPVTVRISGLAGLRRAVFIDPVNAWDPIEATVTDEPDDSSVVSDIFITDHPTVLQLTVE